MTKMQILPTCTKNNHEIPCKITIKASKIDPTCKKSSLYKSAPHNSANSPSMAQISDLPSCVMSCVVKMNVLYVYLYKTCDL